MSDNTDNTNIPPSGTKPTRPPSGPVIIDAGRNIKRFEARWVDLECVDPDHPDSEYRGIVGAEKDNGRDRKDPTKHSSARPCIIVQNDVANSLAANRLTIVIPLTRGQIEKRLPMQVIITMQELDGITGGVAECGHIRSIDRSRIKGPYSCVLTEKTKDKLDAALFEILGLPTVRPVIEPEPGPAGSVPLPKSGSGPAQRRTSKRKK